MTEQIIAFVVALLCCGALVTVYILWLAGGFSNRAKPQSFYDQILTDAVVLKKVEEWLEQEIVETEGSENSEYLDDLIVEGRHECAEGLQNMIKQWRSELDITVTK